MILSVGIDAVEIERFAVWHQKPHAQLARLFSEQEIEYCLQNKSKSAERFAARFAAKEALYKAIHTLLPTTKLALFTVCKQVEVKKHANGSPFLSINWDYFCQHSTTIPKNIASHCSLAHTDSTAYAYVILTTVEDPL